MLSFHNCLTVCLVLVKRSAVNSQSAVALQKGSNPSHLQDLNQEVLINQETRKYLNGLKQVKYLHLFKQSSDVRKGP